MEDKKYYILAKTDKQACEEALERYIDDHGGADRCIEEMNRDNKDIVYFPELYSKIPGVNCGLYVIIVTSVSSNSEEDKT